LGTSFILYLTDDTLSIEYDSTLYSIPIPTDSLEFEDTFDETNFDQ